MSEYRSRYKKRSYREIDRERFRIAAGAPASPDQEIPLDQVIPGILKKLGLDQELWRQQLMEQWATLVGPQLARHARPGPVERRILMVYVTSSAWLHELNRFGRPEILKKVQAKFGADRIRDVRLHLDPDIGR